MSENIVDPKYARKYRSSPPDWVGEQITKFCVGEDGKLDVEALFTFAEVNGCDVTKFKEQTDRPHATGRLRMTVGNMLRARARKRHALKNPAGNRIKPTAEFLESAPAEPVETLDGEPKEQKKAA